MALGCAWWAVACIAWVLGRVSPSPQVQPPVSEAAFLLLSLLHALNRPI